MRKLNESKLVASGYWLVEHYDRSGKPISCVFGSSRTKWQWTPAKVVIHGAPWSREGRASTTGDWLP